MCRILWISFRFAIITDLKTLPRPFLAFFQRSSLFTSNGRKVKLPVVRFFFPALGGDKVSCESVRAEVCGSIICIIQIPKLFLYTWLILVVVVVFVCLFICFFFHLPFLGVATVVHLPSQSVSTIFWA